MPVSLLKGSSAETLVAEIRWLVDPIRFFWAGLTMQTSITMTLLISGMAALVSPDFSSH